MNDALKGRLLEALEQPDGLAGDPGLDEEIARDPEAAAFVEAERGLGEALRSFPVPASSPETTWSRVQARLDEAAALEDIDALSPPRFGDDDLPASAGDEAASEVVSMTRARKSRGPAVLALVSGGFAAAAVLLLVILATQMRLGRDGAVVQVAPSEVETGASGGAYESALGDLRADAEEAEAAPSPEPPYEADESMSEPPRGIGFREIPRQGGRSVGSAARPEGRGEGSSFLAQPAPASAAPAAAPQRRARSRVLARGSRLVAPVVDAVPAPPAESPADGAEMASAGLRTEAELQESGAPSARESFNDAVGGAGPPAGEAEDADDEVAPSVSSAVRRLLERIRTDVRQCLGNPSRPIRAQIAFRRDGRVRSATLARPWADQSGAMCARAKIRQVAVPPSEAPTRPIGFSF